VSHSTTTSVPLYCNPALRPDVAALAEWLRERSYSAYAAERVLNQVAATCCLATAAYLDREDEAEATEVFIEALPEVAGDSPAWDRDDMFLDAALLADGTHPWPIPTVADDDRTEPDDFAAAALEDLDIRPVCGGSEEAEPFEPSPEDLADYGRYSEALDAWRNMVDRSRAWYARHDIAEFNRLRTD
jgi:hypothetical protein